MGKIKLVDGPFPARVELAYFDRALKVTADYTYLPLAEKAADAAALYMQNSRNARVIMRRLLDVDSVSRVSKLDYARLESWTDMLLVRSNKLKSLSDRCVLVSHYLTKFELLAVDDKAIVNKMLGYDDSNWQEARKLRQSEACTSGKGQ